MVQVHDGTRTIVNSRACEWQSQVDKHLDFEVKKHFTALLSISTTGSINITLGPDLASATSSGSVSTLSRLWRRPSDEIFGAQWQKGSHVNEIRVKAIVINSEHTNAG